MKQSIAYKGMVVLAFFTLGFKPANIGNTLLLSAEIELSAQRFIQKAESLYDFLCIEEEQLSKQAFFNAYLGYQVISTEGLIEKNNLLVVIDFSLSANEDRLFVIDVVNQLVIHRSLVSHGKNSGEEFATAFSNNEGSYMSSLGFYVTGEIYDGKHKISMKLYGLEPSVNDNVYERGVVIHAADYVSKEFIKENGRLGRSLGCPALPHEGFQSLVELISEGVCLYIYHPSYSEQKSIWLKGFNS
ncbi:MAG: murein L,D-transpeptidase catalytic domain family protein [Flavobacteriales bacterium]